MTHGAGSESSNQPPARTASRLRRAARQLDGIAGRLEQGNATREELDSLLAEVVGAQRAHFGPRPKAKRGAGAKEKILSYLKPRVGREVHGEELAAVSGINEWARRVRELRVEEGYDIRELGRSTYRLEAADPDPLIAGQWRLANEIRRRKGSARGRIEAFLEANVQVIVTREQIDYVSRIAEGSRRVRELRDEHGWPINSHIDEPELYPGEYRLVSADARDRRDPLQRLYPEDLRENVFARDAYTCQECGRDREKAERAGDSRFYLEVHHTVAVADELAALPNVERNQIEHLITLCHADHVEETAKLQKRKSRRRRGGKLGSD